MNARRLPGVRCSTLKTACSSLLCLMTMPGRIWVAGIDIKSKTLLLDLVAECLVLEGPLETGPPRRAWQTPHFSLLWKGCHFPPAATLASAPILATLAIRHPEFIFVASSSRNSNDFHARSCPHARTFGRPSATSSGCGHSP